MGIIPKVRDTKRIKKVSRKANRHRTATPFPKPRRQQMQQERPGQHDG